MFSNYELVGYFEAILRDDIIRYIKQQVNNNYNGTEAFILVSDHLKAYTTSNIYGANMIKIFEEKSWEEQQEDFDIINSIC